MGLLDSSYLVTLIDCLAKRSLLFCQLSLTQPPHVSIINLLIGIKGGIDHFNT